MVGRRLSPEEKALWGKVAQSVRPLPGRTRIARRDPASDDDSLSVVAQPDRRTDAGKAISALSPPSPRAPRRPVDFLDHGWERRIASGQIMPDRTIDLHGHSLDGAHRQLGMALTMAVVSGARVLLVITGKPRTIASVSGESRRGAIRAEIGHWLATSPHADAISSVRNAHPRHGGSGAIYVILRRNK
ncbi:MAG: Smr/MutS family protein [Sphingobium sp.]